MSVQREIDAELRFHFEARIAELVAQGLSPEEARAKAHLEFGDVERTRASLREIDGRLAKRRRRADVLDALRQDVVYAARSLRRTPLVSLTIIVTLGLGLGANAAMFSLLDTIYLRPPAGVKDPAQIRRVWEEQHFRAGTEYWPGFDYSGYAALNQALGDQVPTTLYRPSGTVKIGVGENAPTVRAGTVAVNYFALLGVTPALGRFFTPQEDGLTAEPVAVISDDFWHRQFNGDPSVLGKTITIANTKLTIIGVAQPGFRGIDLNATDLWSPLATFVTQYRGNVPWWQNPNVNGFQVIFRMTPRAREAELAQRATLAVRQPGIGYRRDTLAVVEFGAINAARGPGKVSGEMQVATRLAGVAIVVLLIACANIVNLLLARVVNRRREIAVRIALGVSKTRLVRLLVTESVLLSIAAAVAAIVAASWGGTVLRALLMPKTEWAAAPLHWRVLLFALLGAIAAGTLVGLVPALQSTAPDLTASLKAGAREGGVQHSRLRGFLVVCQAALSVMLLVGAILFVRSLHNVKQRDVGYAVPQLAFATVSYDVRDSVRDAALPARLMALESRLAAIPGVRAVAFTHMRPKWGISFDDYFLTSDSSSKKNGVYFAVTPNFFATSGMRILRGRTFDVQTPGAPLQAVVDESFAAKAWPGKDAIGQCMHVKSPSAPCTTVVGVVENSIVGSLDDNEPHFYVSLFNPPLKTWGAQEAVLRVDEDRMASVLSALRSELRASFPGSIPTLNTMAQQMEPEYRPWDLGAKLFTTFGVLALIVASIGVFSSVSYAVSRRTHEFGVRIALGARAGDVVRQVVGEGLRTTVIGVVTGIGLSLAAGKLIASLLYGIKPSDPVSMIVVASTLLTIACVAALVPAWRASRADPVSALRAE